MNLKHHADDATLMAYAAGAVTEGFSLVIAAHLEQCPRCRARVADAESFGGQLISSLPQAEMSDRGMDAVWARIEAETQVDEPVGRSQANTTGLPDVLSAYFPEGLDRVNWRTLAPGIRQHQLKTVDSGRGTVRLLAIAPGTTIPHHTHGGSELTLVLRGSFADEIGRFQPGDLADLDSDVHHQPVADSEKTCICLIATDQRLRFSDPVSRILQPLIGI